MAAPADAAVQDHDAAPAVPEARVWRFDDAPVAASPPGMTPHTGTWTIAAETPDPGSNHVVAQKAKNANPVFNVLLIDDVETRDVDISVRLRAISGRLDQGGGLVWRAVDARNYYIARYNPLETNLRVYKVVRGKRSQLASADIDLPSDAWHTLRIVMRDDHITASMNEVTYLDLRDPTFPSAGRIGLWTKADARTYFDDLMLREASVGPDPGGQTNSD